MCVYSRVLLRVPNPTTWNPTTPANQRAIGGDLGLRFRFTGNLTIHGVWGVDVWGLVERERGRERERERRRPMTSQNFHQAQCDCQGSWAFTVWSFFSFCCLLDVGGR